MEEETDVGLDEAAVRHSKNPKKKPVQHADKPTPPPTTAAASSSGEGSLPPAPAPMPADEREDEADEEGAEALESKDIEAIKRVGLRFPASQVESAIPVGCTLRAYEPIDGRSPFWEGKLPRGRRFASPGKKPKQSRSRNWGATTRSKDQARLEVLSFLHRAEAAGVLS